MSTQIVQILENDKLVGQAIITSNESELCKDGTKNHIWNDIVMWAESGKRISWNTHREYAHLDSQQRQLLVYKKQEQLLDSINMCSVACVNCGIAYTEFDNPSFREE